MTFLPQALQFLPLSGGVVTGALTVQGALTTQAGISNSGGGVVSSSNISSSGLATVTGGGGVNCGVGGLDVGQAGQGLAVKEGANAKQGSSVLVAGTVTVANTSVTANSKILLSRSTAGGALGHLSYTVVAGTSFTITSSSGTDTSTVVWEIVEPG